MRATIIGAGVSGLTTAVALREAGWDACVIGRETYESTVSMVAAAVWTATTSEPVERTRPWAIATHRQFDSISEDTASGVVRLRHLELVRGELPGSWWEGTPYVRRLVDDEIPPGFAGGFEIDGYVVEPSMYLRWLTDRLERLGGDVTKGEVERFEDVDGDIVVNCAGLGAAHLADDATVHPIRGQVVAVTNPGIRSGITDETDPDRIIYVYPRSAEVILGGVRQVGRTDMAPDPSLTERILADCAQLDGRIVDLDILEVRVGLRPGRPQVRVERELLSDGRPVVHNYGHGGAGYLLSWGCARDVVDLAAGAQ